MCALNNPVISNTLMNVQVEHAVVKEDSQSFCVQILYFPGVALKYDQCPGTHTELMVPTGYNTTDTPEPRLWSKRRDAIYILGGDAATRQLLPPLDMKLFEVLIFIRALLKYKSHTLQLSVQFIGC